ncbi:sensor histidine kinase [Rhodoferax sp.]|uniref:sensor histidine kinase n=1 Tax=Rhodoferax sp. TaxID=50421 RepID=UPI002601353C|nr:sensor histidine kinase [Rhodoferax sp.]MCM2340088.1 PhnD/SsuA/transferrin family substrate-binding protein [Rhodoferax sp.]
MDNVGYQKTLRPSWFVGLIILFCFNPFQALAKDVAIGVFAYQGEQAATSDWNPLISYLNQTLPDHRFRLENHDAESLRQAIAGERIDLVITNPGYYIAMEAAFGLSRIATLESSGLSAAKALGSVVLVRSDRTDLQELSDLAGKRMAAVAPDAFGGYLLAAQEMLHNGVDPESDLKEIRFIGLPMDQIVEAVQQGQVDAGIVRACVPEQMVREKRLAPADFRVLSQRQENQFPCALSTPLYPNWPLAVTRQTDPVLAKQVARALLSMPQTADGMGWTVPADYQPVHDLYRELRVGPYAYLREITPEGLARRFWPWLLGALMALLAWIIHTVRAEHLVLRRTAQLRDSLHAREQAETRMRESQEQMEHLSRLSVLGELSGNLAHELNQPLTTIGTYARTVLRRQDSGRLTPEAISEACSQIVSEAERAGGIVQRIRHFAKKRSAVREPVDLVLIAKEARHLIIGMLAHPPTIHFDNRLPDHCRVLADGPQIQQVLLNLIKNALDAGRNLPPERHRVQVIVEAVDHWVHLHVIDQGCGLEPPQLAHLFEPFFTTKPDGLGLGLPICKTIIEAHGGRLWAEPNAAGPGMCFSFSLPCHDLPT